MAPSPGCAETMSVGLVHLLNAEPPCLLCLAETDAQRLLKRLASFGVCAREVRGDRMRTRSELFEEFAFALHFPDYFGRNWNALDECLADLSWLPAESYALIVTSPSRVLEREPKSDLAEFLDVLVSTATSWARDRASTTPRQVIAPFHTVFIESTSRLQRTQLRYAAANPTTTFDQLADPELSLSS